MESINLFHLDSELLAIQQLVNILNQKLEKNEGNIKNWVKGVSNNE